MNQQEVKCWLEWIKACGGWLALGFCFRLYSVKMVLPSDLLIVDCLLSFRSWFKYLLQRQARSGYLSTMETSLPFMLYHAILFY